MTDYMAVKNNDILKNNKLPLFRQPIVRKKSKITQKVQSLIGQKATFSSFHCMPVIARGFREP